jgi:hypothetical protein
MSVDAAKQMLEGAPYWLKGLLTGSIGGGGVSPAY